jgi:translation initiation factor IF-3
MPINEKIRADEVMLIDDSGEKLGIVMIGEALDKAKAKNIDLVQVSPYGANPTVCKLLDYGKFQFEKKKNQGGAKKQRKQSLKEIKFRPSSEEVMPYKVINSTKGGGSTDVGDYNIKLKKIKNFIIDGDKTKISVRFRGREILNSNLGLELLNRIKDDLSDVAQVDQEPSLEGRQLLMVLSKVKKK